MQQKKPVIVITGNTSKLAEIIRNHPLAAMVNVVEVDNLNSRLNDNARVVISTHNEDVSAFGQELINKAIEDIAVVVMPEPMPIHALPELPSLTLAEPVIDRHDNPHPHIPRKLQRQYKRY